MMVYNVIRSLQKELNGTERQLARRSGRGNRSRDKRLRVAAFLLQTTLCLCKPRQRWGVRARTASGEEWLSKMSGQSIKSLRKGCRPGRFGIATPPGMKRPTSFHSPEKAKKIKAAWEKEINTDENGKQLPPVKATAASLKDFKKRMKKANPDRKKAIDEMCDPVIKKKEEEEKKTTPTPPSRAAGAPNEECSWLEENWEWVVIIGASVLAVVVIIVIACCCCKSAKRPVPLAAVRVTPGGLSQMPSGVGPTVAWQPVSRTPSGMPRMSGRSASSRRPSGFSGFWPGQSRTYSTFHG